MTDAPNQRREIVIDINPDGTFRDPPSAPLSARIMRAAIGVAVIAGVLALAAFAVASLFILIPIALGAGAVGYGAFRWRVWQQQRAGTQGGLPRGRG
jgi:nitrogen fixation-related uncharacterized protein